MRIVHGLALTLGIAALGCGVGGGIEPMDGAGGGGGGGGGDEQPPPSDVTELVGDIDENLTVTGEIAVVGDTVVKPGVTLKVMPGTILSVASGAFITVEGNLQVAGTEASPVVMTPTDGLGFGGIKAMAGAGVRIEHADITKAALALKCESGAAECAIVDTHMYGIGQALVTSAVSSIERSTIEDMNNAGISISGDGADVLIIDTVLRNSTHDIIVMSGGKLTMDYSELGGAQGTYEHCNIHIGSAAEVLVTNTDINSSIYGMMIGGVTGAVFNNNNFIDNDPGQDVQPYPGATAIDLTGNYWSQGAPDLGAELDTSGALSNPVAAGPR